MGVIIVFILSVWNSIGDVREIGGFGLFTMMGCLFVSGEVGGFWVLGSGRWVL